MAYQHILYDTEAGVARITLNRPEKLNALSQALLAELERALFEEAAADPEVRVVVLRGDKRGQGRPSSVGG